MNNGGDIVITADLGHQRFISDRANDKFCAKKLTLICSLKRIEHNDVSTEVTEEPYGVRPDIPSASSDKNRHAGKLPPRGICAKQPSMSAYCGGRR